ncbi:Ser-Thr-rich glycosyl-phosphatidyl-inositol-anchored membrane family-domain-containing protein [Schizothecium vesticola]|uniref:Ser-Thr-rich glycosyl-phosphatidyl-inositol-anchored membrane family-domain-containing protein n=1 Tax=Schizothecium vesticola TaxID=314040 RepID=A0AA40EVM7_9PEZI|nr:Ser-Thr-rich glycosyl-phosphatidyl-inositol-anchored membrane family-domain-containing protein [Schizothecium vesticola]
MRFSVATVLALATAVFAQTEGFNVITKPTRDEKVPAGSTYEIVWQPGPDKYTGPITIGLVGGATQQTLVPIETLAKAYDGSSGKYSWTVDKSLGAKAIYGIQIFWEEDTRVFQYSFPFQISGGASGSPSGSVSSTRLSNSTIVSSTSSTASSTITIPASNLTTTARTTLIQATTTSTGSSRTTATAPPAQTNAAVPAVGSTLALLGGLAMALFAL